MEPTVLYFEDDNLSGESYEIHVQSNVAFLRKDLNGKVIGRRGKVLRQRIYIQPPDLDLGMARVLTLEGHVDYPFQAQHFDARQNHDHHHPTEQSNAKGQPRLSLKAESTKVTRRLTSLRQVFPRREKDLGVQHCPEQKDIVIQENFQCGVDQQDDTSDLSGSNENTRGTSGTFRTYNTSGRDRAMRELESDLLQTDVGCKPNSDVARVNDLKDYNEKMELLQMDPMKKAFLEELLEDDEISKILASTSSFGSFFKGCCSETSKALSLDRVASENNCCCGTESIFEKLGHSNDGSVCREECKCKCRGIRQALLRQTERRQLEEDSVNINKMKKSGVKFWAKFRKSFSNSKDSQDRDKVDRTFLALGKDGDLPMLEEDRVLRCRSEGCMRSFIELVQTNDIGCDGLEYVSKDAGPT